MPHSIQIKDERNSSFTMLPDVFIDHHMPAANGEFVKVYIYLLHLAQKNRADFSISSAADVFSCTETDILRALLFWEKSGLVALDRTEDTIAGIRLVQPDAETETQKDQETASGSFTPLSLSNDRRRQLLQEEKDVKDILMFAEEYLGRPLSSADQNRLLYLYDELHFSVDLLDYLIEYCVLKEKRNMHYIEKVGLEWYNDGVKTVHEAKERTTGWNRDYYAILRAFGITNRNPVSKEITFMRRWISSYGFSMELIREACARTVAQTGRASFDYAEKILSAWRTSGVHTLSDVESLDRAHARETAAQVKTPADSGKKPSENSAKQNRFNNFTQRDYDYNALEQELLRRQAES